MLLVTCYLLHVTPVLAQEDRTNKTYRTNKIIVKFKKPEGMGYKMSQMVNQGMGLERKLLLDNTFTFEVPEGEAEAIAQALEQDPEIEYAEPDGFVYAHEIPNDEHYDKQWGLPKISAPEAWDLTHGSSAVKVAILDTGIDKDHPDLSSKVERWDSFCKSGYEVAPGCYSVCPDEEDHAGHGTHTGGITAALTNNEVGVAGTGYDIHLLSVKVLDDKCGGGLYSWIAEGIKWAADNGAQVISMSLGGGYSATVKEAVDYAFEQKGVLLVASAGNSGSSSRSYPAGLDKVVAVASTNSDDSKSSFSNYGSWVSVAAPGSSIFSTFSPGACLSGTCCDSDGDGYGSCNGTSMACPFVSGLAGLIFSVNPSLTAAEVRSLIEEKADKIAGTGTYWTHGRINAYQSVLAAQGGVTGTPTPTPTGGVTGTPTPTPTGGVTGTPTPSPTPEGPTATPTPTPIPFNCSLDGDFDESGVVDEADYNLWKTAFFGGSPNASLSCFEYWRRAAPLE